MGAVGADGFGPPGTATGVVGDVDSGRGAVVDVGGGDALGRDTPGGVDGAVGADGAVGGVDEVVGVWGVVGGVTRTGGGGGGAAGDDGALGAGVELGAEVGAEPSGAVDVGGVVGDVVGAVGGVVAGPGVGGAGAGGVLTGEAGVAGELVDVLGVEAAGAWSSGCAQFEHHLASARLAVPHEGHRTGRSPPVLLDVSPGPPTGVDSIRAPSDPWRFCLSGGKVTRTA